MNINKWQDWCRFFCTLVLSFFLSACSISRLDQVALKQGLNYQRIETDLFQLAGVIRREGLEDHSKPSRIYLEGDGIPWRNNEPSANPTGQKKLGFQLFLQDESATAYLTRPCYEEETMPANCTPELWTSGRYSETVVSALMQAIEQIAPTGDIELVGYSGGGTLATLIAHRLPSVSRVLTLAANLDHDAWSEHHGSLPLTSSLNPVDDAPTSDRSELHLFGADDTIAPAALAQAYFEKHAATVGVLDGFTHHCCWVEQWPKILEEWETAPQSTSDRNCANSSRICSSSAKNGCCE